MEQVWDTTDKQVETRMKRYYSKRVRDGYQPFSWKIFVTSPRAFNKFVVDEVGDTFPKLTKIDRNPSIQRQKQQFILSQDIL